MVLLRQVAAALLSAVLLPAAVFAFSPAAGQGLLLRRDPGAAFNPEQFMSTPTPERDAYSTLSTSTRPAKKMVTLDADPIHNAACSPRGGRCGAAATTCAAGSRPLVALTREMGKNGKLEKLLKGRG